jgi:hypothetical protein
VRADVVASLLAKRIAQEINVNDPRESQLFGRAVAAVVQAEREMNKAREYVTGTFEMMVHYSLASRYAYDAARMFDELDERDMSVQVLDMFKGEGSGHEFHGNQWTGGFGGDGTSFAPASAVGMTSRQRQDEALRLRNQGMKLQEISDKLKFNSPQAARQAILAAQERAGGTQPPPSQPEPQPQPTTQPEPIAPVPQTEQTGPTLQPQVLASLQKDYATIQKEYDQLRANMGLDIKGTYDKLMPLTTALGSKVTDAVNARFAEILPKMPEGIKTQDELKQMRESLANKAADLNMNQRIKDAADALVNAAGSEMRPAFEAALKAAGVPEGHPAYELASDPSRLYDTLRDQGSSWTLQKIASGNGIDVQIGAAEDGYRVFAVQARDNTRLGIGSFNLNDSKEALTAVGVEVRENGTLRYGAFSDRLIRNALGGTVITNGGSAQSSSGEDVGKNTDGVRNLIGASTFDTLQRDNASLVAEYNALENQIKSQSTALSTYENQASKTYTDLLFNTLGSMRPLAAAGSYPLGNVKYGTPRDSGVSTKEGKALTIAAIEQATQRLPKDWIDAATAMYGPTGVSMRFADSNAQGWWKPWDRTIFVGRVAARPGIEVVGRTALDTTLLHEMTHSAQYANPEAHQLELAYMRAVGTGRITTLPGFGRGVTGDKDNFTRVYSGRAYNGDFREVLTTGMEAMITPAVPGSRPHEESFGGNTNFQNFMTGTLLLADRKKP